MSCRTKQIGAARSLHRKTAGRRGVQPGGEENFTRGTYSIWHIGASRATTFPLWGAAPMSVNRAARRRAEAAKRRGREAIWRHLIEQSAGCLTVTVIRVGEPVVDPAASAAIVTWITAVVTGELDDPLCLLCNQRPTPPGAFSILTPYADRPEALSISAICVPCASRRSDAEMVEAAGEALKHIFPNARRLDPAHMQHAGGRA